MNAGDVAARMRLIEAHDQDWTTLDFLVWLLALDGDNVEGVLRREVQRAHELMRAHYGRFVGDAARSDALGFVAFVQGATFAAAAFGRAAYDERDEGGELAQVMRQRVEHAAWLDVVEQLRAHGVGDIDTGGEHERLHDAIARWGEYLAQLRMYDADIEHAEEALAERRAKWGEP